MHLQRVMQNMQLQHVMQTMQLQHVMQTMQLQRVVQRGAHVAAGADGSGQPLAALLISGRCPGAKTRWTASSNQLPVAENDVWTTWPASPWWAPDYCSRLSVLPPHHAQSLDPFTHAAVLQIPDEASAWTPGVAGSAACPFSAEQCTARPTLPVC